MTPETSSYTQFSFLPEASVEIVPQKTFISLSATRLAQFMKLENPVGWIVEQDLAFLLAGKEKSPSQARGISIHEGGYFYLLMAQHPLPPGKDAFLHTQEIAQQYLPNRFPTANNTDLERRKMILTQYLPEIWPKVGESFDKESVKKLFDIVHQNTLYPHPPNQPHLTKFGTDIELDSFHCLKNLVRFSQAELLPRIAKSEYTLCEFTIIQFFRNRWNIKVTSMADLLIVSRSIREDGVPVWTYDLFDIKSGRVLKTTQKKSYLELQYQLWLMKRALERTTPEQIQEATNKKEALHLSHLVSPLETVRVNCHLIWPAEYLYPEFTCELVDLPDEKKAEKKLYQVLTLCRQFRDGKLRKGLSSDRELLFGEK